MIPSNQDVSFPTPSLAASLAACPPRLLLLSSLLLLLSSCRFVRFADVLASLSLSVQRTDDRCAFMSGSNGSDEGAREGSNVCSLDKGAFWTCRALHQQITPDIRKEIAYPFRNVPDHITFPYTSSESCVPLNQFHPSLYHSDKCFPSIYSDHHLFDYRLLAVVDGGIWAVQLRIGRVFG